MKRLTAILVAGLFVLAPLSASAMEMMSDSNMKDVTGQAGVSIAIDDVVLYQESIADTTYWDTDGTTEYTISNNALVVDGTTDDQYGVNISYTDNTQKLITIDAIVNGSRDMYDNSNLSATFDTSNMTVPDFAGIDATVDPGTGEYIREGVSALSIDVGTCDILTQGKNFNIWSATGTNPGISVAGIVIGLPTVEIMQFHTADMRTISVTTDGGTAINMTNPETQKLITIEQSGTSKMAILGGTLEIAPH
ncbi:MAG: hypothetical protein K9K82_06235 [Desulfobacteraceae bacterium]|nr:hypothetical protein [Desulfobacteraceae bacterium]